MLAKFMTPGTCMTAPKAEADAHKGGRFSILMATSDQEIPHGGAILKYHHIRNLCSPGNHHFQLKAALSRSTLHPAQAVARMLN